VTSPGLPTDLLPLFTPPAESSQNVSYRQGVIKAFNQNTLQNTVTVGGVDMFDLPVLGVAETASYRPGVVVGLMVVNTSWSIIGRFVIPNTADATDAITQLGQGVVTDFIATNESTTSGAFTDLATIGPTVTINIKASGKALVIFGCTIGVDAAVSSLWGGFMNFVATGANSLTTPPGGLGYDYKNVSATVTGGALWSISRIIPLTGLNPGLTTFVAKYAVAFGGGGETAFFKNRSMAIFAL